VTVPWMNGDTAFAVTVVQVLGLCLFPAGLTEGGARRLLRRPDPGAPSRPASLVGGLVRALVLTMVWPGAVAVSGSPTGDCARRAAALGDSRRDRAA
jgi:hypothetical protein